MGTAKNELLTFASATGGPWDIDENFHDAADKQQLSWHVKQTVEYIDFFFLLPTYSDCLTYKLDSKGTIKRCLFSVP